MLISSREDILKTSSDILDLLNKILSSKILILFVGSLKSKSLFNSNSIYTLRIDKHLYILRII